MAEQKILIIDDEITLLELLSDHIRMVGYHCLTASGGQDGLGLAENEQPDLIVLDVMMPGMDGWEVCRQLRDQSRVPIIMLTAKGEEFDKLRGFRMGIDDYVTKPFSFAELVARIGAVLARIPTVDSSSQELHSGDLIINFREHRVSVASTTIDLTPTEYRLLETLARNPHHTIPTDDLLEEVWGFDYAGQADLVKHYIWSLRQKIEQDPGDPKHIVTERGFGYRFE